VFPYKNNPIVRFLALRLYTPFIQFKNVPLPLTIKVPYPHHYPFKYQILFLLFSNKNSVLWITDFIIRPLYFMAFDNKVWITAHLQYRFFEISISFQS